MRIWTLRSIGMGLAVAATAGAFVVSTAPQANADVCANVGNQVSVSDCVGGPPDVVAPHAPLAGFLPGVSDCAGLRDGVAVDVRSCANVGKRAAASVPRPIHRPHHGHHGHHGRL
jgi:hypothetical protein